jgi:FkbM family methyltransferase
MERTGSEMSHMGSLRSRSLASPVRKAARRILNELGYDLIKRVEKFRMISSRIGPSGPTPINVFQLAVKDLMNNRALHNQPDPFFFVQIGAHDGLNFDPMRFWVEKYHWRGILVEPQPRIFERLVRNYRDEPQLLFERAAIHAQADHVNLYAFKQSAGLPDHATMLASLSKEALLHNGHNYVGDIEELVVPALTLPSLLAKYDVKRIDLLQIDTEGYDFEIVKMIEQTNIRPSLIHYESGMLPQNDLYKSYELLDRLGYRVLTIGIDTLAYIQEDDAGFGEMFQNMGYDLPL